MQSMFDERLWLAWLVKVRIIILTLLLGIELAIARLTPVAIPAAVCSSTMLLWYTISIFYLVLLSFWEEAAFKRCCRWSPTWCWSRWWSTPRAEWTAR